MADIFDNVVRDLADMLPGAVDGVRTGNQFTAKCESPIELAFAAALSISSTISGFDVRWGRTPGDRPSSFLMIEPQAQIGEYRVDFLCAAIDARGFLLSECVVVECDGHEWHEKTKEQAARDKARDRYLQLHVAGVIHFTGSELFRAPGECVRETMEMIRKVYHP